MATPRPSEPAKVVFLPAVLATTRDVSPDDSAKLGTEALGIPETAPPDEFCELSMARVSEPADEASEVAFALAVPEKVNVVGPDAVYVEDPCVKVVGDGQ